MASQSTLDRIPRIERLAALVQAAAVLVIAVGLLVGLVLLAYTSTDPRSGEYGRHHGLEGLAVILLSPIVGLLMLFNATYVQHRLIIDRADAQRE